MIRDVVTRQKLFNQLGGIITGRKGKVSLSLSLDRHLADLVSFPHYLHLLPLIEYRLELNHRLQSTILEPRHTEIIVEKLANVHAQGRRSRVLDVGAVSPFCSSHSNVDSR